VEISDGAVIKCSHECCVKVVSKSNFQSRPRLKSLRHVTIVLGLRFSGSRLWPLTHAGSSSADISTLMMEAIRSSETSVYTRSTQRHVPEDGILLLQNSFNISRITCNNRKHGVGHGNILANLRCKCSRSASDDPGNLRQKQLPHVIKYRCECFDVNICPVQIKFWSYLKRF
jgi:hypothetical protein